VLGSQCRIHVVHQGDVGRVVQRRAFSQQPGFTQNALCVLVTLFGQENLVAFFVHGEVTGFDDTFTRAQVEFTNLLFQPGHDRVDAHVHLGMVFRLTADDEWRTGFVDQNRVNLVHDGV